MLVYELDINTINHAPVFLFKDERFLYVVPEAVRDEISRCTSHLGRLARAVIAFDADTGKVVKNRFIHPKE